MQYSVAIVILNWNGWDYTQLCIKSLLEAGYSEDDLIIVDNASTDGSIPNIKKQFPKAHLILNKENEGFTGGNNRGIQYAIKKGYAFVLLLNNDTQVLPGFLERLIEEMKASEKLAAIQPLIYYLGAKDEIWNAGGDYHAWLGYSQTNYKIESDQPYLTDWISGCAILVRSTVLETIGLLDHNYFAYFEDVDWSLRMRSQGFELKVHPQSIIYHEAGAASKSETKGVEGFLDPKVHFLNVRNQVFQLRKYCVGPKQWLAWPFHFAKFALFIIYFTLKGRHTKSKAVIKGIKEGLKTPLGINK
ncbi:glycosyltransferase family 2 protein [Cyclobacterium sp. 1_MG-2023]|uniref:glycosyltransferase family 2 protein n=1 Tax=Cyclobacterium sp. 1_MG-2023 TaxID=3062681 RepID=UPI0026E3066D|nr:glycosyltransferase family 2 protein [Cyclobacterium sp. 1_MG-2023]MDO6439637.1 glycosyltransferase family 2 protein [Cyclobacterium sp. 1_MG-2023]